MGLCHSVDRKEPGETSTTATETADDTLGSGRWRRPRGYKGGGEGTQQVLDRLISNGSSKSACLYTQQGKKGTNQDAMLVFENFCSRDDTVFCGVFDGHGPFGHMVAKKVRDTLPSKLSTQLKLASESEQSGLVDEKGVQIKCTEEEEAVTTMDEHWCELNPNGEQLPEMYLPLKQALLKSCQQIDKELKMHPTIDCFCSGTTSVTLIKQGEDLVVGNIGDSRAVLATRDQDNALVAVQLTIDLKPDLPSESARIQKCKGRVFALQDEPEVARVWLPDSNSPGLAMARAFGDFCLKDYGLISVPDINYRRLTEADEFIILASDGVWDVLSNKEAVDVVASAPSRSTAARALVDTAVRSWRIKYPTSKNDDCTVVCLFLQDSSNVVKDSHKEESVSISNKEEEEDEIVQVKEESTPKSCGIESKMMTMTLAECISVAQDDEEWSALEGLTRVNSLLSIPRFFSVTMVAATTLRLLLICLSYMFTVFSTVSSVTDPRDAAALRSLMDQWDNTPPSWGGSDDPCGTPWEGVSCNSSRITALGLSTMGLKGRLSGDIGELSELRSLDLSFNPGLTGSLTSRLRDLQKLNILILAGCGFTGSIPSEIGYLKDLSFLALNSNNFTGKIPASLGNLSKVYWLDLADNQLTGPIPISSNSSPGLDLLLKCKHFHFNKNQLSGTIPPKLFSSEMILIHVLFDGNQFTGSIPSTLGLVQTLEVLRLDRNTLTGKVPENLSNLTNIIELNLAHNKLVGSLPDLSDMKSLNYVDLSNNSFDPSESPLWFSTLPSLTTLVMEYGALHGPLPNKLFEYPQLQQVKLRKNAFNGTLSLGDTVGPQLQLVDLQDNDISSVTLSSGYTNTLILVGNPVCTTALSNTNYCQIQQKQAKRIYSTSLANCGGKSCPLDQKVSPQSCECAYPYEGTLYFRGPMFRDLTNANTYHSLEMSLWVKLGLTPGSVSLQNPFFNNDDYLQIQLELFPSMGKYFNRSEVQRIGFDLSNQTYKPPPLFGPYYFIASPYTFPAEGNGHSLSSRMVTGIITGCSALVLCLVALGIYAFWQKRRAEQAIGLSRPFVSWASSGKDSGGAPQLKGARWFSYEELKKITNNFSMSSELGSGGYGKVYKGMLSDGQMVAIKRAQQGSTQGGHEFKTEIELLSRVHHKNLVGLIGFCFEQGEQILVYEFMSNGSLKDSLTGRSGIALDWKRRLRVALGSARGLAYLHELADPPIIHRDVKSTNILLDENLTAKVADFGLSKLVSDCTKGHVSTQVKGTLGYLDPEYYTTQKLTEKSDVYSFGVVLLELITAKQPIEKGKYIVREIKLVMNKNDEEFYGLRDKMDRSLRDSGALPELGRYMELALKCVDEMAAERPTMSEVVKEIEIIIQNSGASTSSSSASASSSATDFGGVKGGDKVLYGENLRKKEAREGEGAFDYSGGYSVMTKVEPK
ncbi:unnamed protein product [Eruca vesicaria subsp. sativa]|uniref:Protein kinase domain-containing protein n=1 Tax=Eruca vesicaria subsp. sativa TaxID=29727 RepID=A0ABC8JJT3_ERUVS|nr:unnamed protein product [Eruca vesicaria subsp. sativa]